MLNSIGLDNDGIDAFLEHHMPYLRSLDVPIVVSIAGRTQAEFTELAARLDGAGRIRGRTEYLLPQRLGGRRFRHRLQALRASGRGARDACQLPIIAKLTPNVTRIVDIARAAEEGGADALSLINTCLGMAIDWRRRRPILGAGVGGLSGPAIKPIALRAVYQVAQAVRTPVVGIGGIATIDDVMEFFVAGASGMQVGTANFYRPTASIEILDALPGRAGRRWACFASRSDRGYARHRFQLECEDESPFRHPTDGPISLGQLFRRDPPVHRFAGPERSLLLHRQPARPDHRPRSAAVLEQLTLDAAIDLLALGLDPERATLFVQSDVPEVCELCWLLMTGTPMGLLGALPRLQGQESQGACRPTRGCSLIPC